MMIYPMLLTYRNDGTLTGYAEAKATLAELWQHKAETFVTVAGFRREEAAMGYAAGARGIDPAATAEHAVGATCRPLRIVLWIIHRCSVGIISIAIPVAAPVPQIAAHVVKA
jgi:hypothetical protein